MKPEPSAWPRWVIFTLTAVVGLALDLITKVWAFQWSSLAYHGNPELYFKAPPPGGTLSESYSVISGWWDFRLAMNEGAAFSIFHGQLHFFMIITVAAILTLLYFVHTAPRESRFFPFLLGLIFSGVLGNFWDRVVFGGVRDFVSWHTPEGGFLGINYTYPTFNVADIWIFVGAIVLAFATGRNEKSQETGAPGAAAPGPEKEAALASEAPNDGIANPLVAKDASEFLEKSPIQSASSSNQSSSSQEKEPKTSKNKKRKKKR